MTETFEEGIQEQAANTILKAQHEMLLANVGGQKRRL